MNKMVIGWVVGLLIGVASVSAQVPPSVRFTDITKSAGVRFVHNNGAFGKKYLPETMGGGVALFDADNDGDLDILFVNGMDWKGHPTKKSQLPALYIQESGRFVDKTKTAGLAEAMYGMGVATADYDADGDTDIFISCLGEDRLYRNKGNGTFTNVTRQSGIRNPGFSMSAAWFDYDHDGHLDLYVCNYVEWSIETDIFCTLDGNNKSYCTPESYKGSADKLFKNNGNGTFTDVSQKAGVHDPTSKSLGVLAFDYDGDGWEDIFVANDTQPNKLYENQKNGTFKEVGMLAGIAFDDSGIARAGMGVDAADFDRSGRPSLVITNFSNQMISLYKNEGNGLFVDSAPQTGIGRASLLTLGFGCFFFDANCDGWLDLFVANGHVENEINRVQKNVLYAELPHLFMNNAGKSFKDAASDAGFKTPLVARGAAYGDIDNDGDLDIVISTNGGEARLYRNDSPPKNSLRLKVQGARSNKSGIGAKVTVKTGGGGQMQLVRAGSSYCSTNELPLTFGLGADTSASEVEIVFPGGGRQTLRNVPAGQTVTVTEGKGITSSKPYARPATAAR